MTDKTKGAPARSALKLALEALECDPLDMALNPDGHMGFRKDQAITAIREALAEPSEALALVNKVDQEESSGIGQPAIKQDLTPEQPAPVAEPREPQQEPVAGWDSIEAMAEDRYKVIPSHDSMFYRHAVVAGNGAQQLYLGRELECENMARKFAGAFLDGAFVMQSRTSPPIEATPLASQRSVKPWVGLTEKEINECWPGISVMDVSGHFYHAIEAKLKEKNSD